MSDFNNFTAWGGRFNGALDLFWTAAEAEGYAYAEQAWPYLVGVPLTLLGLSYSHLMAPNPPRQPPSYLQYAGKAIATTIVWPLKQINEYLPYVPGFSEYVAPALKTIFRYVAPQVVLHEFVAPLINDHYENKGKAFTRPAFEEFAKWQRSEVGASRLAWRDFVPSQAVNPGWFYESFRIIASTPLSFLKALCYDIPRNWGFLRRFGVEPRSIDDFNAEVAYAQGKTFFPSLASQMTLYQNVSELVYSACSWAVYPPLYVADKFKDMVLATPDAVKAARDAALAVHQEFDSLAKYLDQRTPDSLSADAIRNVEYGVAGLLGLYATYKLTQAASWAYNTIAPAAAMPAMPAGGFWVLPWGAPGGGAAPGLAVGAPPPGAPGLVAPPPPVAGGGAPAVLPAAPPPAGGGVAAVAPAGGGAPAPRFCNIL